MQTLTVSVSLPCVFCKFARLFIIISLIGPVLRVEYIQVDLASSAAHVIYAGAREQGCAGPAAGP